MSILEIEAAIEQLPAKEVSSLMSWLESYHAKLWDEQIADDLDSGRLDSLLRDVEIEYEAGVATPL
jgi:HD superfamily phosphohydrolase